MLTAAGTTDTIDNSTNATVNITAPSHPVTSTSSNGNISSPCWHTSGQQRNDDRHNDLNRKPTLSLILLYVFPMK